mmetsp:Transcript_12379/g.23204  ORF Transcript_12379/g.23204 Transcript_12379/m.23204 type:complete len:311 (+) Transcript_12379:146-1078(+)|eukprot:CAMPEP_0176494568 /NCGR_PEP_ID=MMETSP0200_2-20121128/10178_1 /TAXON_ID=947934 /ORGANISM="Chaetoceros sp., Strain GSL56" /LENGTH=310 /DNA_ID=CAMNT_0017892359 /DNA_START=135 /DNA_END=1067 /DNA_ORIENTATION=+
MLNSVMESSLLEHDEFRVSTANSLPSSSSTNNNSHNHNGGILPARNNDSSSSSSRNNRVRTRTYPVVEVIAPETLSEGYTFDVEVNHEILSVVVPHGGVQKGQTFRGQTKAQIQNDRSVLRIPMGGWKDGLFDFCRFGPFHSSLVCATCCPLVALGQIYTRLNLNWYGTPNDTPSTSTSTYSSRAFKIMVLLSVTYGLIIRSMVQPSMIHFSNLLFLFFSAILIGKTRTYIRQRYEIQATFLEEIMERGGCRHWEDSVPCGCDVVEDYCVSCFCTPCSVSQMSRHTASYDTYEGSCFSSNGLPPHAPVMF